MNNHLYFCRTQKLSIGSNDDVSPSKVNRCDAADQVAGAESSDDCLEGKNITILDLICLY